MSTDMTAEDSIKLNQTIREIFGEKDLIIKTVEKEKIIQDLKKSVFGGGKMTQKFEFTKNVLKELKEKEFGAFYFDKERTEIDEAIKVLEREGEK